MDKAIINIIYTDSLESILVKGEEMEDISSIQDIPIPEWFSELDDRSGWGGLIICTNFRKIDKVAVWGFYVFQ